MPARGTAERLTLLTEYSEGILARLSRQIEVIRAPLCRCERYQCGLRKALSPDTLLTKTIRLGSQLYADAEQRPPFLQAKEMEPVIKVMGNLPSTLS